MSKYELPVDTTDPRYEEVLNNRSWLRQRVTLLIEADKALIEKWRSENPLAKPGPEFIVRVQNATPLLESEYQTMYGNLDRILRKEFGLTPPKDIGLSD